MKLQNFDWRKWVIEELEPIWLSMVNHRCQEIEGYKIFWVTAESGDDPTDLYITFTNHRNEEVRLIFHFPSCVHLIEDLSYLSICLGNPKDNVQWVLGNSYIERLDSRSWNPSIRQVWDLKAGHLFFVSVWMDGGHAQWGYREGKRVTQASTTGAFKHLPRSLTSLRRVKGEPIHQRIDSQIVLREIISLADFSGMVVALTPFL